MLKKIAGVVCSVAPLASFAAVPTSATDAVTAAGVDASTVGWAVFGVLALIWGVKKVRAGL